MDDRMMKNRAHLILDIISSTIQKVDLDTIVRTAKLITNVLSNNNKVLLCGNGGSAADAQHIAAEFVGRFMRERRPLPAIALNTNVSVLTAIGNDYGFEEVFARQVNALGAMGDLLIAISTSGKSPNILRAIEAARRKEIIVVGLTGEDGGTMKDFCDVCIRVPSNVTPRIQEMHIIVGHILCELVEESLS